MKELRDSFIIILIITVLTTIQALNVLNAGTYQLTEDTRAVRLVADCELWDIEPPAQLERTLVLACPGVDAIRLWPQPVQQPWAER